MSPHALAANAVAPLQLPTQRRAALRAETDRALQHALHRCAVLQARHRTATKAPPLTQRDATGSTPLPCHERPSVSETFDTVPTHYSTLTRCLAPQTREQYFNTHKRLFRFATDAAVVHSVAFHSVHSGGLPVAEAVTWAAYGLFPLHTSADACQFETTGEGVDAHGEPYGFNISIPAELDELRPIADAVRIALTSVVVTRPHHRKRGGEFSFVYVSTHHDFRCSSTHSRLHGRLGVTPQQLASLAVERGAPSAWALASNATWVPATPTTSCGLCHKPFSILRAKHACVVCAGALCRKCLVKASEVLDMHVGKHRAVGAAAKLCSRCITELCPVAIAPQREEPTVAHDLRLSETPSCDAEGPCASRRGSRASQRLPVLYERLPRSPQPLPLQPHEVDDRRYAASREESDPLVSDADRRWQVAVAPTRHASLVR